MLYIIILLKKLGRGTVISEFLILNILNLHAEDFLQNKCVKLFDNHKSTLFFFSFTNPPYSYWLLHKVKL